MLNKKRDKKQEESSPEKINAKKEKNEKNDFEAYGINEAISNKLKEMGITTLFDVQKSVYKPIYNGENVMASALTGSGKTLGFVLPTIQKNIDQENFIHDSPKILVMAPTRELSIQISGVFSGLITSKSKYKVATIYGGVSIDDQSKLKFKV